MLEIFERSCDNVIWYEGFRLWGEIFLMRSTEICDKRAERNRVYWAEVRGNKPLRGAHY